MFRQQRNLDICKSRLERLLPASPTSRSYNVRPIRVARGAAAKPGWLQRLAPELICAAGPLFAADTRAVRWILKRGKDQTHCAFTFQILPCNAAPGSW
jgi:hypothetical protein